jgi:tRNA U34 5-methylaminomethyl-2-thiouridine-forming methyltransferase MnmC
LENRVIQVTADGSHTIAIPELNLAYHSRYGAMQESRHVFIKAGLHHFLQLNILKRNEALQIFELGFGTGLNALLSLHEAVNLNQKIYYDTVEPFPISIEEAQNLNYSLFLNGVLQQEFIKMHQCEWNEKISIHPLFLFEKSNIYVRDFETEAKFHVIYFDAFDPGFQPGLWTENVFSKMFGLLYENGILATYSSKGSVRKHCSRLVLKLKKISGPQGKREIIRATK